MTETVRHFRFAALLMLVMNALATSTAWSSNAFVRPAELEADVAFWRRVYTEVSTNGGLIHDPYDLGVIYETLKFPG